MAQGCCRPSLGIHALLASMYRYHTARHKIVAAFLTNPTDAYAPLPSRYPLANCVGLARLALKRVFLVLVLRMGSLVSLAAGGVMLLDVFHVLLGRSIFHL